MMSHFNDTEDNSEKEATESKHAKKPKLAKHTTMKGTAKVRHMISRDVYYKPGQ